MKEKISRLKKISTDSTFVSPNGIYFQNDWEWVDNNPITKIKYNTNLNREWLFDDQIDNMEWELQK